MITTSDIDAAAARVAPYIRSTPVLEMEEGAFSETGRIHLKLELLQHTGSFKPRGIFNRILSANLPDAGVIVASGGNAGLAVAHATRLLGVKAEIFVPQTAPRAKVERLAGYGAQVIQHGRRYAEALEAARRRAADTGALVVHAYDQPEVMAGQGTIARELQAQLGHLDTVLVAVGGGGLIGGIATWLENADVRVVAVEPDTCPTLATALKHGGPTDVPVGGVAADSLGASRISAMTADIALRSGIESVLVTDAAIVQARRTLWAQTRVAAEPGGATALAALTSGAYRPQPAERVAVIICGGNADPGELT